MNEFRISHEPGSTLHNPSCMVQHPSFSGWLKQCHC